MKRNFFLSAIIACFAIHNGFSQEVCLQNAWKAFNSKNYNAAISCCDSCIDEHTRSALRIQHQLDSLKLIPEIGAVNETQKNNVFRNALLNDVSTACFIRGRSAELLYKTDKVKNIAFKQVAIDSYKLACKFSKGRAWDSRGWFWSPCEASSDRLPIE